MTLIFWIFRLAIAAFGLSVSLAATYLSQRAIGADQISMFITMGVSVGATVLIVSSHEAWLRKSWLWAILFAAGGIACAAYGMTASLTGDATIKDVARSGRIARQASAELERGRRQEVGDRIRALETMTFSDKARLGATTPEMVQPTVDALRGCDCDQLKLAKQKLAAAKELAELRRRRDGWGAQVEEVPTMADPGIETMTTVAHDLGVYIPVQSMRAGLSVWKVMAMELMAILIPIAAFSWGRRKSPVDIAPSLRQAFDQETSPKASEGPAEGFDEGLRPCPEPESLLKAPNPSERPETAILPRSSVKSPRSSEPSVKPSEPGLRAGEFDLRRWAAEGLVRRVGQGLQSKPLYEVYVVWCQRENVRPLTLALFGKYLPDAGYPKGRDSKTGHVVYQNVALKQHNLKVVK